MKCTVPSKICNITFSDFKYQIQDRFHLLWEKSPLWDSNRSAIVRSMDLPIERMRLVVCKVLGERCTCSSSWSTARIRAIGKERKREIAEEAEKEGITDYERWREVQEEKERNIIFLRNFMSAEASSYHEPQEPSRTLCIRTSQHSNGKLTFPLTLVIISSSAHQHSNLQSMYFSLLFHPFLVWRLYKPSTLFLSYWQSYVMKRHFPFSRISTLV